MTSNNPNLNTSRQKTMNPNSRPPSANPSARTTLHHHLLADFGNEPVEDGMDHEAERTLGGAFGPDSQHDPQDLMDQLLELCTDVSQPTFASSVLRCLSRLDLPGTPEWRQQVVANALRTNDVEIRDAAIQAVEHWQEQPLVNVLKEHHEPLTWLRDYLEGVVSDLEG